jgi:hypothetical protein
MDSRMGCGKEAFGIDFDGVHLIIFAGHRHSAVAHYILDYIRFSFAITGVYLQLSLRNDNPAE